MLDGTVTRLFWKPINEYLIGSIVDLRSTRYVLLSGLAGLNGRLPGTRGLIEYPSGQSRNHVPCIMRVMQLYTAVKISVMLIHDLCVTLDPDRSAFLTRPAGKVHVLFLLFQNLMLAVVFSISGTSTS